LPGHIGKGNQRSDVPGSQFEHAPVTFFSRQELFVRHELPGEIEMRSCVDRVQLYGPAQKLDNPIMLALLRIQPGQREDGMDIVRVFVKYLFIQRLGLTEISRLQAPVCRCQFLGVSPIGEPPLLEGFRPVSSHAST